jgi:hypothetical protein
MNNNSVLSYKDWLKQTKNSSTLLTPYQDYLDYVNTWYEGTFGGKTTAELTADEYREFLLTLKIITTDEDVLTFIDNLNYSNPDEVETAIPYFAKNLRDIAKYISVKRDDAKYANSDYSFLGSNAGLEMEIYRSLLNAYISNSTLTSEELLALVESTSIEIEELYDDNEYMDKSPNKTADDYFDMDANASFYADVDPDYLRWVVAAGFNELYSNNDLFNPPVSGTLPLSGYIAYDADSEQTSYFKGNLPTNIMGEEHFYLSGGEFADTMGTYSDASKPWDNLSNRYFPTIANLPLIDTTYSKYDIGGFLIPSKLGMVTALGRNKFYKVSELEIQGTKDNFPDPSIYSNGYSFSKEYQDASIVYDSYLNWIDIKQVSGRGKGILASDGTYQEMTPYQTSQETTSVPFLGMNQVGDKTDPWYLTEDKTWEDNVQFPPDFRNIYDIEDWYTNNVGITGEEDNWAMDIYGNNYGLYKENNFSNFYEREMDGTGKLYVRGADGTTTPYATYFEDSLSGSLSGFGIDSLRTMEVYHDIVVMEDSTGAIMAQKITLEDGEYTANSDEVATIFAWSPFDHFYDDRTNELYVGRYEIVDGFVEIIVYKYSDGRFIEVYNTEDDTSGEMVALRSSYSIFTDITQSPSMTISPVDDKLFLTYIGGVDETYIVTIPLTMTSGLKIDEVVAVNPVVGGTSTEDYATESRKLLKTMISEDKLILMLEGSDTDNKYLQVIPL